MTYEIFFCAVNVISWMKPQVWWINIQSCVMQLSGVWSIKHIKLYANFWSICNETDMRLITMFGLVKFEFW